MPTAFLTFDDGPHQYTSTVANMLHRKNLLATFFVLAKPVESGFSQLVETMAKIGHFFAVHDLANHDKFTTLPPHVLKSNIVQADGIIARVTGRPSRMVRPPYGDTNDQVKAAIREIGFVEKLWDVDSRDWDGATTPQQFRSNILDSEPIRAGRNAVILLHDWRHGREAQF